MHEALIDADNDGAENIAVKYVQECQIMANLRHPNVALFLGVCFLENCLLPVLLMEKLDDCLDNLLETVPNIPLALKRLMLEDVARGLLYLHSHNPQIIHRDLTAKNVLLTSHLVSKLTDFGNSRIVNLQPGQLARTLSRLPGTLVYMPPEAFEASSRYGPSLDIFSFGHLSLFVGLQVILILILSRVYTLDIIICFIKVFLIKKIRRYSQEISFNIPMLIQKILIDSLVVMKWSDEEIIWINLRMYYQKLTDVLSSS